MLEFKTVLLIFGIVFLMVVLTRKAIQKQNLRSTRQDRPIQKPALTSTPRMTEEQFNKSWRSLSYLMLLAGAGNLYMVYNAVRGALDTRSYILWIDSAFSLTAAVIAVLIWRYHRRNHVITYLIITIIPIMFFISTGHSTDGLIRLFPLVLVYFVVKPVWEFMDEFSVDSSLD